MSFWDTLLKRRSTEPTKRTRICVECGMPVAEHKSWCSILRGQQEMDARGIGFVRPASPPPGVAAPAATTDAE
ncbi:MAG: hypothetical protein U0Q12_17345 [Vicinamibacterales bacterium]